MVDPLKFLNLFFSNNLASSEHMLDPGTHRCNFPFIFSIDHVCLKTSSPYTAFLHNDLLLKLFQIVEKFIQVKAI
jgi:hypothetical protein